MMKRIAIGATAVFVGVATSAIAAQRNAWDEWLSELKRQCPSHHVDWVFDGGYDDLLGNFEQTLPPGTRRRVLEIEDYSHRCAKETLGFSCEMSVGLDAYVKLGLLEKFVTFGCRHYRCVEIASCTGPGFE